MQTAEPVIRISIRDQRLDLLSAEKIIASYPISTSRFGVGSDAGSFKTPVGRFRIGEKIGADLPLETIFRGRVPLEPDDPLPETDDLIMSRILWLEGVEPHNANTRDRFIYIHGTKHEQEIGRPASCGCVRMRKADIADLFNSVAIGAEVRIET